MREVLVVAVVIVLAWATSEVAERRGYEGKLWSVGAVFAGPFPLLALLIMGRNPKTLRTCADCKTKVPFDAAVCRHCGRDERTATA